jgi:hypothetical protein
MRKKVSGLWAFWQFETYVTGYRSALTSLKSPFHSSYTRLSTSHTAGSITGTHVGNGIQHRPRLSFNISSILETSSFYLDCHFFGTERSHKGLSWGTGLWWEQTVCCFLLPTAEKTKLCRLACWHDAEASPECTPFPRVFLWYPPSDAFVHG